MLFFPSLQAVWLWTVSLPVTVVNSRSRNPALRAVDIVGWIMWSVGFLVEATADHQKFVLKNSQENIVRTNWCNVGLWQYSRHPNYFGKVSA
jgi:steroid 5-alpha reductase family enzyme